MKKWIAASVIVAVIVGGFVLYQQTRPSETMQILNEMRLVLDGTLSDVRKLQEIGLLRTRLAGAYSRSGRYDKAIEIITQDIETTRKDGRDDLGRYGKRSAASYAMEASQFRYLAAIYVSSGDKVSAEKAEKKAQELDLREKSIASNARTRSVLD